MTNHTMTTGHPTRAGRLLCAWQLAVLRYAVTHEVVDRQHVMALAKELDQACGGSTQVQTFCFFRKTSAELCQAIVDRSDSTVLDRFVAELGDSRLKRAFLAVMDDLPVAAPRIRRASVGGLFRGLPSRSSAP